MGCGRAKAAAEASRMVRSPLTGELVAVDQMAEHMRVSLIDPKWRIQREAMLSKIRETTKASDEEIGANLIGLARKRPDVFGACLLCSSNDCHNSPDYQAHASKVYAG